MLNNANELFESGFVESAEKLCAQILYNHARDDELNQETIDCLCLIGDIHSGKQDYDASLKSFTLAHSLAPDNLRAAERLAYALTTKGHIEQKTGNYAGARDLFEKAYSLNINPEARLDLSNIYYEISLRVRPRSYLGISVPCDSAQHEADQCQA